MQGIEENQQHLTAAQFAAKFKSKKEVYSFLTIDAGAYLPEHQHLTIYYLKDLISGKKKFLKQSNLKHLYIPQYEGLEIESILKFLADFEECFKFLPIDKEIKRLPKQFVVNLAYSILGQQFSKWVKQRINERNSKLTIEKNLNIEMDPDIARAFMQSTSVSLSKGIGANMLKVGCQRRRSNAQVKQDKIESLRKQREIEQSIQQIQNLKRELDIVKNEKDLIQGAANVLNEFMSQGVIIQDHDGGFTVPSANFSIREQVQQPHFNI